MDGTTIRNLDIATLRSFVTVAELGGVTRAAARLNLTQSAVSMQLKRLETSLDQQLVERAGRGVCLTREGEQLLGYGRRILTLHDEAWQRMTHHAFDGRVSFGVPDDLVDLLVSPVMRDFAAEFPRARFDLTSSFTRQLIEQFNDGQLDVMLTTEPLDVGTGECLYHGLLIWYVGQGSLIWKERPLPLATKPECAFQPVVIAALETAGIPWERPYAANHWRDFEAIVNAGLAVEVNISLVVDGRPTRVPLPAESGLPPLPDFGIFLYVRDGAPDLALQLAGIIRDTIFATAPSVDRAAQ
jgi:DNA-binding transcriptional LysR family regulator